MPSTQKDLATGLNVSDMDSNLHMVIPLQGPINETGWPNECVQLLICLAPSNVTPLKLIHPLRPPQERVLMWMLERIYVREG